MRHISPVSHAPTRMKVDLPDYGDNKFGDKLSIDLMFLGGSAILHIVHTAAHFP